ncbi:MAG: hypothetical protein J6R59_07890 [Paludibacteraceae bacterium]|nr:hypothetical protein [Paludibacteraceae bacterium]
MNLRLVNTITVRTDFDELSKIVVNSPIHPTQANEGRTKIDSDLSGTTN